MLQGRRRARQRAAAAGSDAHPVDARAQQGGGHPRRAQSPLERRGDFPRNEANRHRRAAAHHVQRVASHCAR